MTEFKVGDVVKRRNGRRGHVGDGENFRIESLGAPGREWTHAYDQYGDYHFFTNLELVTAATTEPRPFQVGDVVRVAYGNRGERTVSGIHLDPDNGKPVGLDFDGNHGWDMFASVELVTPAPAKPARKLGETPEADDLLVQNIAINDPRIAWIWADLATYADGKSWCSDYDELAKEIGIPGRKKEFSGSITLAGTRIPFTNIEADSNVDAERVFREQVATELNGTTK